MLRLFSIVILFCFLFASCNSAKLRQDPSPSVILSNYPSAEFKACNNLWHGLGYCELKRGAPFDDIALSIQGYFDGTVRIVSTQCDLNVDETFRYSKSEAIRYKLPQNATNSCLIGFTIEPELPDAQNQKLKLENMKGFIWVAVTKSGNERLGYVTKLQSGLDSKIEIPVGDAQGYLRTVLSGCGPDFDKLLPVEDGHVSVKVSDLGPISPQCVLSGGVKLPSGAVKVAWLVWSYAANFIPLSTPTINVQGQSIDVLGDNAVSVVMLDSTVAMGNAASFHGVDLKKPHVLRLMTVKGRSSLGVWSPEEGKFKWIP